MGQSISFLQFDEKRVRQFWEQCLQSSFSITTTNQVDGLANIIRSVEKGDYVNDVEAAVWEIDDLIIYHYSRRHFFEYEADMTNAVKFWLGVQANKSLGNDFDGVLENIDPATWQAVLSAPKKLAEIQELIKDSPEHTGGDLGAEDLLDYYLKIKGVFEYSGLTDTQMVVLPEDRGLSVRWTARLHEISARAVPILRRLQDQSRQTATEYQEPPFLQIPVSAKEFFIPTISVVKQDIEWSLDYQNPNTHELQHDIWASRVLPGETYNTAIQRELRGTLGYTGSYQVAPMKTLLDQTPDNSGTLINRYGIHIKLMDEFNTNIQVMGYLPTLTTPSQNTPHNSTNPFARRESPSRDQVIAALKRAFAIVPPEEMEGPDLYEYAYTHKIKEFEEADRLYDAWSDAEEAKVDATGTKEARAEFGFSDITIYWDAGFDAVNYLDELANEWLINELSTADELHMRGLSDRIKATIDEINERIKDSWPDHKLINWKEFYEESWNPSRTATPSAFYTDYAYWRGGSAKVTINDAVAEYKKFHPDAKEQAVRIEMEAAAANYKEIA